jgi:hypothetical protein
LEALEIDKKIGISTETEGWTERIREIDGQKDKRCTKAKRQRHRKEDRSGEIKR